MYNAPPTVFVGLAFIGRVCVQELDKSEIQVARRPAKPGTLGKAMQVVTNFYRANFQQVPPLMHHDIRVDKMRFNKETGVFCWQRSAMLHAHCSRHHHLCALVRWRHYHMIYDMIRVLTAALRWPFTAVGPCRPRRGCTGGPQRQAHPPKDHPRLRQAVDGSACAEDRPVGIRWSQQPVFNEHDS